MLCNYLRHILKNQRNKSIKKFATFFMGMFECYVQSRKTYERKYASPQVYTHSDILGYSQPAIVSFECGIQQIHACDFTKCSAFWISNQCWTCQQYNVCVCKNVNVYCIHMHHTKSICCKHNTRSVHTRVVHSCRHFNTFDKPLNVMYAAYPYFGQMYL